MSTLPLLQQRPPAPDNPYLAMETWNPHEPIVQRAKNAAATLGVVLGVVGMLLFGVPALLGAACSVIGFTMDRPDDRFASLAGLVVNGVALLGWAIVWTSLLVG